MWFEGSTVADSARRYRYADERGSIVAVTDSSGNVLNVNTYDEYGIPGSGNAGTFQYTGQAWLPELGMYYYKARMYSPTLGRFMQTDPIGYGDGMNMYAYVGSDPVNGVDPSGLFEADPNWSIDECYWQWRQSSGFGAPTGSDPCTGINVTHKPWTNEDMARSASLAELSMAMARTASQFAGDPGFNLLDAIQNDTAHPTEPQNEIVVEATRDRVVLGGVPVRGGQFSLAQWFYEMLKGGARQEAKSVKDNIKKCLQNNGNISPQKIARDTAKGARNGAVRTVAVAVVTGGEASAAGIVKGAAGGALTSAVLQACSE